MRGIRKFGSWIVDIEPLVLIALLIVVVGCWFFAEIVEVVYEGESQAFDNWMVTVLRDVDNPEQPIGPEFMAEIGRDLTALGGTIWLTLLTIAVTGFLWLNGQRRAAAFVLFSILGGLLISSGFKAYFDRPRPDIVPHLSHVYTSSFPSGHSMMAAVVYLTLGTMLASFVHSRALKVYFLATALLLTVLVGLSRVYMGVHYPTDVLAGWTVGLVWAVVCWLVWRRVFATEEDE